MVKITLLSTVALAMLAGCPYSPAAPTVAPGFADKKEVSFVDGNGVPTTLTLVDYKARTIADAVSLADLGPGPIYPDPSDPITPDVLISGAGTIAFAFDELLDGYTVETPVYKSVAGVPITIGQGNWKNKFRQVVSFTPIPTILKYVTSASPDPLNNILLVAGEYHPDGGWAINAAEAIYNNPPPAIVVRPADPSGFPSGQTVILHLVADQIAGISGVLLPAATNAAGAPITLALSDGTTVEIAATLVFTVP
jgi:hypothetical protein